MDDDDFGVATDMRRVLERYMARHGIDLPEVEDLAAELASAAESAFGM